MEIGLFDLNTEHITNLPDGWPVPRVGELVVFVYDNMHPIPSGEPIEARVLDVKHHLYFRSIVVTLDYQEQS